MFNLFYKCSKFTKKVSLLNPYVLTFLCFVFSIVSSVVYMYIFNQFEYVFKMQETTSINWITQNNYAKQKDYVYVYGLVVTNVVTTFLLCLVLIKRKKK